MEQTMQLRAGAGAASIRFPEQMFPTDGFCAVHDDPRVRVLLLDCGVRFAVAAVELVVVAKPFVAAIKQIVHELTDTPEENIWVHGTHVISTPHAPGPKARGPVEKRPPISEEDKLKRECFANALNDAARTAARAAMETLRPARLGVGTGSCDVNRSNRELEVQRGLRSAAAAPGPCNKTMTVLRAEDMDGRAIGFLVSYGIMSRALDNSEMAAGTRLVSSDVPGAACRAAEEKLGAPVLFCMSAAADQSPAEQTCYRAAGEDGSEITVDLGVAHGLELVERYGAEMGRDIVSIAGSTSCADSAPALALGKAQFQWDSSSGEEQTTIALQTARLGDVALVGFSPEINCATELELKAISPFAHTLLISMLNGPAKYIPDAAAFRDNTYEARNSFAKPGVAEEFVRVAAQALAGLAAGN